MTSLRLVRNVALPSPSLPPLIPRLGLHDELLLVEFEGFGMQVVGRTVAQATQGRGLARLARDRYGVEVLIDPDTWRNQLPVCDRPKGFQKASFAVDGVLDLSRRTLSSSELSAYARLTLGDLTNLRASIYVAPYHFGGGPDCPIRGTDLRLLRRTADAFRSLRLNEPRPDERFPVEHRLFAGIAVRPHDLLDPAARQMLVHLYAGIDVSGYLVKIVGLSEDSQIDHIVAAADFVFSLYLRTSREVVLGGGKNLALAFVAAGLPAAMLGIAEGEVFHVSSGGRNQGGKPIYCSSLWRSVRPSTHGSKLRAEILFDKNPCDCGHHSPRQLPEGLHQLKRHTLSKRLRDFGDVATWDDVESRIAARVRELDRVAKEAGYPATTDAFVMVVAAAARARRRALGNGESEVE